MKMFPKKVTRSRSIFFKLLLSYMAILLITLSVGCITYYKSGQIIKKEANRYNNALLKQVSQAIDTQLRDMEQLAIQIAYDKSIEDFAYSRNPSDSENEKDILTLLQNIFDYKSRSHFLYDTYVYFEKKNMIISPTGCWKPDFFYDNFYRYKDMDYAQWYQSLHDLSTGAGYIPLQAMYLDKWQSNILTYTYPLQRSPKAYSGSVVMLIDEKNIYKLLKDIEIVNNGTLYVINGQNRLIASTATNYDMPISLNIPETSFINNLPGKSGLVNSSVNGRNVVISYTSSNINDWKFISIVPEQIFMEKVENIKNFILIVIALGLAVGILLAYYLANKNYNPVKELIHLLMNSTSRPDKFNTGNEYDLIKQVVVSTMDESHKLKDMLENQRSALRFSFLSRLLNGNISDRENITDSLEYFNIQFISDQFAVMLIHIDCCDRFIKNDSAQEWALVNLVISNTVEEIINLKNRAYSIEVNRRQLALLINFDESNENEILNFMVKTAEDIKHFLGNEFGFILTISIGNVYSGVEQIAASLKEAQVAFDYKIARGCDSIICFRDIREDSGHYYYPLETELKLINYIKAGKQNQVENLINSIFEENFSRMNLPYRLIQCLFFDIMSTAVKTLNEIKVDYVDIFDTDFDPLTRILECQTVKEIHETVISIYSKICSYIVSNRKSHNTELREKIETYVRENYSDCNLCVADVAKKIGVNASYLSSFYKEQTDQNLTDYINSIRLKKAEELLKSRSYKINEIAEIVGYGTTNTFIRIFKKGKGITPGEYRDNFGF